MNPRHLRRAAIAALALFAQPTVGRAQTAVKGADEGLICLPTRRIWNGSPAEARDIRAVRVPESFKKASGGGCGGPADAEDLIEWHNRFGDATSATGALRFIIQRDGDPEAVARLVTEELRRALEQLDAATAKNALPATGVSETYLAALPDKGAAARAVGRLMRRMNWDVLRRVEVWLRPAEVFGSKALFEKATAIFAGFRRGESLLAAGNDRRRAVIAYIRSQSSSTPTTMEIDLRLAVLAAQIDRRAIKSLPDTLARYDDADYRNVSDLAFHNGDDFCDLPEDQDSQRALGARCRDEYTFRSDALAIGYAESMLNLLSADKPRVVWSWEHYADVYERDAKTDGSWSSVSKRDRILSLMIAAADSELAAGTEVDRLDALRQASTLLMDAATRAPPFGNAVRFRQIAERALAIDAELARHSDGSGYRDARFISFLRLNLSALDKIVSGVSAPD